MNGYTILNTNKEIMACSAIGKAYYYGIPAKEEAKRIALNNDCGVPPQQAFNAIIEVMGTLTTEKAVENFYKKMCNRYGKFKSLADLFFLDENFYKTFTPQTVANIAHIATGK